MSDRAALRDFLLLVLACLVLLWLLVGRQAPREAANNGTSLPVTPSPSLGAPDVHGELHPGNGRQDGLSAGGFEVLDPVTSGVPAPSGEVGTVLVGGWATWFETSGYQAAVPWWEAGDEPYPVRVCADGSDCLLVTVTGFCACGERHGIPTVADLSPLAFTHFAPLSVGVIRVTLEWPVGLPATDGNGS